MSRVIVRTIYGSAIQTARSMGLAHDIPGDFSSLHYGGVPVSGHGALNSDACIPSLPANLLRGMQVADEYNAVTDTNNLKVNVLCIGNGGHRYVAAAPPAPPYSSPIPHKATDSGFYNWIPFLMREIGNDIAPVIRANYRLRRTVEIGGNLYIAYFGKLLDFTGVTPEVELVNIVDGAPVGTTFTPTINSMDPNPTTVTDFTINDNSGTYASVAANLSVVLTASEVAELLAACELMFGSEEYAIISEIALCAGVDKDCITQYDNNGLNPTPMGAGKKEVVGVQPVTFISTHYPVVYANDGFSLSLDLGATEPLFGVGNV